MKKKIYLFLLFIMFIPFYVKAETCDTNKVSISSISIEQKSDNVKEIDEVKTNGKNINVNLSMSDIGDNIEYKIIVKNDSKEDYVIDNNSLNINSKYLDYSLKAKDNSNVVKSNTSKTIYLKIVYKNKVPNQDFDSGTYNDNKTIKVNLMTKDTTNAVDNPNTKVLSYIVIFIILLIINTSSYMILRNKKNTKLIILIFTLVTLIPISIHALCSIELNIKSNITIVDSQYVKTLYGVYPLDNQLTINQIVPDTTILRTNPNEAMADWGRIMGISGSTKPFYLKHKIQNNIVKESNLIFIVSEQMASENPGMIAGTFELIGGYPSDDEETLNHNREIMYEVFDYEHYPSRCYRNTGGDHCVVPGLHVDVYNLGIYAADTETYENQRECIIYFNGNSFCSSR